MESSSIVSRARTAFHSAAAKAERVLTDIKSDLSTLDPLELEEQPPRVSVDNLGAQFREECESKFRWRSPNIGTKQEWQERFKNMGRGKKGIEESERVENPKMPIPMYGEDIGIQSERLSTELKLVSNIQDSESSLPECSAFLTGDIIPPAPVLKQLAIESGKNYGSIKNLLNSSRNSSPVKERATLSISAMKSLMCREKDEKFRSEHQDDQVLCFLQSILDAEGLNPGRKIGCFIETRSSSMTLPRDIHGAPPESLVSKLAEIMGSFKTLQKMALFWSKFVLELRKLWLEDQYIPGIPEDGTLDLNYSLLYQQLQVMNCCISRKKRRASATELLGSVEREGFCNTDGSHFLKDCRPSNPALYARISTGELVLRLGANRLEEYLTMLETGEPIYAPLTQEAPLLTEDLIREHEEFVLRTGSVGAGCSQLLSDMQAFKAANPGCILEDFVRWHSPPDWEADSYNVADDIRSEGSSRGRLSSRMKKKGNLWHELWETAKPVPAVRQVPLFDEDLAVEGILSGFEAISPSRLFEQLFLSVLGIGFVIAEATLSADDNMSRLFYECKDYVVATCQSDSWNEKIEDLCQVYDSVEAMLVRPDSFMKMIKQREEEYDEPKRRFMGLSNVFNKKNRPQTKTATKEQRSSDDKQARHSFSSFFDNKSSLFSKKPPKPENPLPTPENEWMFD
ncbi:hypothetical protein V2J09_017340 [Rumex salicifolius]